MPHQCTDCGRTFDDGSKEMLSGCPNCGGNKFQFRPDAATREQAAGESSESASVTDPSTARDRTGSPDAEAGTDDIVVAEESPPDPPERAVDSTVARTVGRAATTVRDFVGSGDPPRGAPDAGAPREDESRRSDTSTGGFGEDTAQASARTDVVSPDDLPPAPEHPATADPGGDASSGAAASVSAAGGTGGDAEEYQDPVDRPDLADLREELNQQFESIKVLEPGQYELNLMELYDREEYIIALQEDGKYTIQVPDGYGDA
jgi:predicted  nucleic acid-binding Zn-ribbon protein